MAVELLILTFVIIILLMAIGAAIYAFIKLKKWKDSNKETREIIEKTNKLNDETNKLLQEFRSDFKLLENDLVTLKADFKNSVENIEKEIKNFKEELNPKIENFINNYDKKFSSAVESWETKAQENHDALDKILKEGVNNNTNITNKFVLDFSEALNTKFEGLDVKIDTKLTEIEDAFKKRFENEMTAKLKEHFANVTNTMSELSKNLTKFETVQDSVKNVEKIFSNVKSFGAFGEKFAQDLIEESFGKTDSLVEIQKQFVVSDSETNEEKTYKPDFSIKVFDVNGESRNLFLDAKFPLQKWKDLTSALEEGNKSKVETASKNLTSAIKNNIKDIKRYVDQIETSIDFAIMFLPSEGLYAWFTTNNILVSLARENNIVVCGPTTLVAIINTIKTINEVAAYSYNSLELVKQAKTLKKSVTALLTDIEDAKKWGQRSVDTLTKAVGKSSTVFKNIENVGKFEKFLPDVEIPNSSHVLVSPSGIDEVGTDKE
ncbi:DNA recombination protein RmuC [Mycoplasma sp. 128]